VNAPNITQKTLSTAQAEAALAGATLQRIEADDGRPILVLTRDAFTAQLNNIEQASRVLAGLANHVEVHHGKV